LANQFWFWFLFLRIVFENKNKKTVFCCFFVKKVFGKLFLKTVFENRKQYLRNLDNCFQNSFHLKNKIENCLAFLYIFFFFHLLGDSKENFVKFMSLDLIVRMRIVYCNY
jgi:hypothetical protein